MPTKRRSHKTQPLPDAQFDSLMEFQPAVVNPLPIIKVVGVSGSGKSTLVAALRKGGYDARPVSQEHSNVPTLWQQFDPPSYLVFLYVSLEMQQARRQDVTWTAAAHSEELRRLSHARDHADLSINTDGLTPTGVYSIVRAYFVQRRVRHASGSLEPVPATGSATKTPDTPSVDKT